MKMNIWLADILNQLFMRGSYTQIIKKNKVVDSKTF